MDFEYKAFISYSHRDARWAEWLLHALETYRLPDSRTRGVGRVFRDRDEAGAGDLRDEIQRALAASENLIVIASPNSARSTYVQAEIESFVQQRAESDVRGRIVTLIVDGEPNVSAPGTIDPRECFPPALRGGIVLPDGTVFEPLAADARSEGDGRTRALAKVVAGLMDIRYDTLVRRDLRRRRRARMIAAAGTIAGVAIAGLVTAVIIAGNLEQERLRVASENAAREARTVAAVNDAERAKRLLESGNFENALDLALRSLPLDGSVPFIPQAYDVLYRLAYDRRQEVEADLAGFYRNAPVVLPAGPGHYLIYNDTGTAAIWSTSRGVVYRRSDLEWEKRPTLAADGSAIFVPGVSAMLRLSLPERIWTSIELTGIWPDLSMPDYAAAIDRSSFYACHDKQLSRIAVDDELRGTTSWHVDLPAPCNAMTLTPGGGVAIAIGSFAFEFGPDGIGRRLLGPAGDTAAERIYAVDDAIILASVGGTYSYRGYDNRPTVIEGRGMDYFALSPDGKRFTYTDSARGGVVIADLATGEDRLITCTCRFIGYLDANRILTIGDRVVEAHAVDTLASLGPVHLFAADADAFAYLPADNLLMALRQSGTESVAFLDRKGSRTLVADGNSNFREALLFAALTGSHSILTRDIGPDGVSFNLTAVAPTGSSAGAVKQALPLPARAGAAYPLSDRSFAVVTLAQDLSGWTIGAYDGDSGAELWAADSESNPAPVAGSRFLAAQSDAGLTVFDAATRTARLVPDSDYFSWAIEGDRLIGARGNQDSATLDAVRLHDGGATAGWSQQIGSLPYLICIAPASEIIYLLRWANDAVTLERRSSADGSLLDALTPEETTLLRDGKLRPVLDYSCDATSLRLSDSPSQQWRWDSAADLLAVEAKAPVPPRDEAPPTDTRMGPGLEDAVIGWDSDGAWLYDPSENRVAIAFASGGGRVSASAWVPDAGLAVLGFESGRLEIWDAEHPSAPMIALEAHTTPVIAVDYDPARGQILSADQEGTIHLWPLPSPEALVSEVRGEGDQPAGR